MSGNMFFSYTVLGILLAVLTTGCSLSQENRQFRIETKAPMDQSNNICRYLTRVAYEITENSLADIHCLKDWQKVRPPRYAQFLETMGLVDVPASGPRPPLNVQITGTIQQSGYRIEKLYYESLPGLYVPANLYIPDGITKPAPAILYLCGHADTQKVHYQTHPRKLTQLGFVCLIIETIQLGEVKGEHWGCYARGWFHWYSRGYTPGGVELWNAMRALDLLCQRPEVDADKLGVTGISGGGAQTWYLAAADPRIKAAAAVCGNSSVNSHIFQRSIDMHCDCMTPINTYQHDYSDIGALIAPRPFLIAAADLDKYNVIEGTREIYRRTKKIYQLYDQTDNITLIETPGGHSYHKTSRTRLFSFFLKHLMGKNIPPSKVGDIDESDAAMLSAEQLKVYVAGPPADDRTKTIQDTFIKPADPPALSSREQLNTHREKVRQFLREKTFSAFPRKPSPLNIRWESRGEDSDACNRRVYSFVSEKDFRLKVDIRLRPKPGEPETIMLVLCNPDEYHGDSERFAAHLKQDGNIAYFEARGVGETGWSSGLQRYLRRAAAWTGRTIASMQVYDVLRCLEVLRTLPESKNQKIALAARGSMCAVALYAALLDGGITTVILQNPPATQNAPSRPDGRGEAIEMLNCLRITDLAQVAGLLLPTNLIFAGSVPDTYRWAEDLYQMLGVPDAFQKVNPEKQK